MPQPTPVPSASGSTTSIRLPRSFFSAFFALAALEGVGFIVYLIILKRDPLPTQGTLGMSPQRLLLLAGVLAGTLTFSGLWLLAKRKASWDKRLEHFSNWLFGHPRRIPALILGIVMVIALVFIGVGLSFQTEVLRLAGQLNAAYLARLLPYLLWPMLWMLHLGAVWVWVWKPFRLEIKRPHLETLALAILFLVSFSSRALMTNYSLPYPSVWDEVVTYSQSLRMLTEPGLKPVASVPGYGASAYGDLLVYLTTAGQSVGLLNALRTQQVVTVAQYVSPPAGVPTIYQGVSASGIPLLYPRLLLALINSLAPLLVFRILRSFLRADLAAAFGAALVFGIFSRELIYYSSFILPDALATTLFLCLVYFVFQGIEDCSLSIYSRAIPWLFSGLLVGLMVSTSVRYVVAVGVPLLSLILAKRKDGFVLHLGLVLGGTIAAFALTSPYALLDLPAYLGKVSAFAWYHNLEWTHRIESLYYYLSGMFLPGFSSTYVDTNAGSIGFGPLVGLLALLGIGRGVWKKPRQTLLLLAFGGLHLFSILSVVQRYTRHALVLYPIACLFAGLGLTSLADWLRLVLRRQERAIQQRPGWKKFGLVGWGKSAWQRIVSQPRYIFWHVSAPLFVLTLFLLISANQIKLTLEYISRMHNYQTSQQEAQQFLAQLLGPGEKVGILDVLPWEEADLDSLKIDFERIRIDETVEQLQDRGVAYIVGTDDLGGDYSAPPGSLWDSNRWSAENKLAQFGWQKLQYAGYPTGTLYLFVARLPVVGDKP